MKGLPSTQPAPTPTLKPTPTPTPTPTTLGPTPTPKPTPTQTPKPSTSPSPSPTPKPTATPTPTPTLVWPGDKPLLLERTWEVALYPYLQADGQATYPDADIVVVNYGDASSYSTSIELYTVPDPGAPTDHLQARLKDCTLLKRWSGVTMPPAGRLEFKLTSETLPALFDTGIVDVVVVYDPLLDPKGFSMDSDAQLKTVFRSGTERNRHIYIFSPYGSVY